MTGRHKSDDHSHQPRRDRMYEERVKDPYLEQGKPGEPTVCPGCGAIFSKGHWQWGQALKDAQEHRCPACRRIHDKVPAGILTLKGEFFNDHRDEITKLVHHVEEKEKAEHPLERIMNIEARKEDNGTDIYFTGIHITKAVGEAVHHAYKGEFNFDYSERDDAVVARWER